MGYRSDVHLKMEGFENKEAVQEYVDTCKKEFIEGVQDITERIINSINELYDMITINNDSFYFKGDYLKWYDNYVDVRSIMCLIDGHDFDELGLSYHFVRVGETDGDVDHLCNNNYLFGVYTTVEEY